MVRITVVKPFYDLKRHKMLEQGDEYEATEERAAQIDAALPGYITHVAVDAEDAPVEEPADDAPDYESMPYIDLVSLARDRGIQVKGRPKKADLIEALTKE